ncbi:hypothetical protein V8G54_018937 [Vigna mungo]|uniref:Uncharacterized protein n=1 Tax=Vigna mungo TaxID=3915 RepID=A0AAQ3NA17_VIGMU
MEHKYVDSEDKILVRNESFRPRTLVSFPRDGSFWLLHLPPRETPLQFPSGSLQQCSSVPLLDSFPFYYSFYFLFCKFRTAPSEATPAQNQAHSGELCICPSERDHNQTTLRRSM